MEGTIRKCTDGTAQYILEFDHPINLVISRKDGTEIEKNGLTQAKITVDQAYSYQGEGEDAVRLCWPLNKLVGIYVIIATDDLDGLKFDGNAVMLNDFWLWLPIVG